MKYGMLKRAMPVHNGTIAFCFFPYRKNPNPIDPKTIPQISSEVVSIVNVLEFQSQMRLMTDLTRCNEA